MYPNCSLQWAGCNFAINNDPNLLYIYKFGNLVSLYKLDKDKSFLISRRLLHLNEIPLICDVAGLVPNYEDIPYQWFIGEHIVHHEGCNRRAHDFYVYGDEKIANRFKLLLKLKS